MVTTSEIFIAGWKILVVRLSIAIYIGLGTTGVVWATSETQSAPTTIAPNPKNVALAMPSFLRGVELGMSPERLASVRENFRAGSVTVTNVRAGVAGRVERVEGSPFVDKLLYVHSETKPSTLGLVAAMKSGTGMAIKGHIRGFVQGAVALWGNGYSVHISKVSHAKQREYEAISLLWKIDGKLVACTFPSPGHVTDDAVFGFFLRVVFDQERKRPPFGILDKPKDLDLPTAKREVAELLKEGKSSLELLR